MVCLARNAGQDTRTWLDLELPWKRTRGLWRLESSLSAPTIRVVGIVVTDIAVSSIDVSVRSAAESTCSDGQPVRLQWPHMFVTH